MTTKSDLRQTQATLRAQLVKSPDTLPVLMDEADVIAALDIDQIDFDRLVRSGKLENAVVFGARRLFRRVQVRDLVLKKAPPAKGHISLQ